MCLIFVSVQPRSCLTAETAGEFDCYIIVQTLVPVESNICQSMVANDCPFFISSDVE